MRLRRNPGFTLIELMVVIVILGGLIALVGPDVFAALFKSNIKTAEAQMQGFAQAIDLYKLDKKKLPSSLQDLLQTDNERGGGAYMKTIPKDPWGNEYEYRATGNKDFTIRSYGDDGQPDTEDDIFWPKKE